MSTAVYTAKYSVANLPQNGLSGGPPVFVSELSLCEQMTSIDYRRNVISLIA
jgi:hypothetical protein